MNSENHKSEKRSSFRFPWRTALLFLLLGIVFYRISLKSHYVKTEGKIVQLDVKTSKNATQSGCIVSYHYQVEFTGQKGEKHLVNQTQSKESQTCRMDEFKEGSIVEFYYNPLNPSDQIESPVDNLSLGLFLMVAINGIILLVDWFRLRKK